MHNKEISKLIRDYDTNGQSSSCLSVCFRLFKQRAKAKSCQQPGGIRLEYGFFLFGLSACLNRALSTTPDTLPKAFVHTVLIISSNVSVPGQVLDLKHMRTSCPCDYMDNRLDTKVKFSFIILATA